VRRSSLTRAFAVPLAALTINAAAAECTLRPQMLHGAWLHSNRAGYFEQMEFSSDGGRNSFNSWLHDRPEIAGATWTLDHCILRITKQDDASFVFVYTASMKSGRLELREAGQPVATYKRVKE